MPRTLLDDVAGDPAGNQDTEQTHPVVWVRARGPNASRDWTKHPTKRRVALRSPPRWQLALRHLNKPASPDQPPTSSSWSACRSNCRFVTATVMYCRTGTVPLPLPHVTSSFLLIHPQRSPYRRTAHPDGPYTSPSGYRALSHMGLLDPRHGRLRVQSACAPSSSGACVRAANAAEGASPFRARLATAARPPCCHARRRF
jgi:hypothetical protein